MTQMVRVVLVCLLFAAPAAAQMQGNYVVGVGVAKVKTTSSELESKVSLTPIFSRLPSQGGWGFALAFNWLSADVNGSVTGVSERLGRLNTRPVMVGIAYTAVRGRFYLSPSIVAGPAVNTLKIDDRWDGVFEIEGSSFERKVGEISLAVRPGVNLTYALTSRMGLTGFGGYFWNRPEFHIDTPNGPIETKFNGDGFVASGGVIFSF